MILSISDIDINKKSSQKTALIYLIVAVFCLVFGIVYEVFSHGVISKHMVLAFLIPLLGGALPFFLVGKLAVKLHPFGIAKKLYNSGIAIFTVWCVMKGVLVIYGTTNHLLVYYVVAGVGFLAAGIALWVMQAVKRLKCN